jgi:hypothetical protein
MPFVITQQQDEEQQGDEKQDPQAQDGFVIAPREEVEDTGFDFLKDIVGPAKEFGVGTLNLASMAFGGGPDSIMSKHEEWRKNEPSFTHDIESALLRNQGLSDEEITKKIGERPVEKKTLTLSEGIDELTGGALVPVTARQRMTQKAAREAGEFAATEAIFPGSTGAKSLAKWAGVGGLFGLGEQIAEESGGGEGAKLGTGAGLASLVALPFLAKKGFSGLKNAYQFGRGLLKSKTLAESTPRFLTEAKTPKALADLKLSAKDLTGRVAKTSEEMLNTFDKSLSNVAEPSFKDVGTFRAANIEADILKQNQKAILDTISPAAETQKKSWESLQNVVEENFKAVRESYRELYKQSEQIASKIKIFPKNTYDAARELRKEMHGSLLSMAEEGVIKSAAEKLSQKLAPSHKKMAKILFEDLKKEGFFSDVKEVASALKKLGEKPVPPEISIDKLMKTKRGINRILSKSDIIPAPVDLLKSISRELKIDILKGLEASPKAREMYVGAEGLFAKTQNTFNNDVMVKMRKSPNPEDLTPLFTKPSNTQRLNNAIGNEPKMKDLIDRLIVENIASKPKAVAQELARESREFLSKKSQRALDSLLEYGDTLTSKGQQSVSRGNVLQDLQKSFETGSRPDYTLKLMQNETGYGLVKNTLNRSPKGKKMWKSLQRQTFEDMIASVLDKDKVIDFEKARDIFSDKHLQSVVKEAMGPEGVNFFNQLQNYGQNMAQNIKNLASKDKGMFERFAESYLPKGIKYSLYAMVGPTHGLSLLPFFGKEVARRAYRNQLYKILENPKSRSLIKEMGKKSVSPEKMKSLLKQIGRLGSEEYEKEE